LEGDFKRLVSNAKETNPRQSEAFGDAERIRKAVSNLMTKHNPAYKTGNYQAVATPLPPSPGPDGADEDEDDAPGEEEDGNMAAASKANGNADEDEAEEDDDDDEEEEDEEDDDDADADDEPEIKSVPRKRRGGRPSRGAAARDESRSESVQSHSDVSYKGLNFQKAQEKLVADLLQKDDR
jgi:hypothetical protein